MSDKERVISLQSEVQAVQEILFGVLIAVGEPVHVDIEVLKQHIAEQKTMIDATLDKENGVLVCRIVDIPEGFES